MAAAGPAASGYAAYAAPPIGAALGEYDDVEYPHQLLDSGTPTGMSECSSGKVYVQTVKTVYPYRDNNIHDI